MPDTSLVVLISGNGSNLQAILDAAASGALPARVAAVVSNRRGAFGLERARRAGVPALVHALKPYRDSGRSRAEYDADLANLVAGYAPDWVMLAGWMHVLGNAFLHRFPGRVVNLHPALPGTFPGTDAIARAWAAFQRGEITHTGVMLHLVPDEGVDSGPVLAQETVAILPEDTLEGLETRIHAVEHRLVVHTLTGLARGELPEAPARPISRSARPESRPEGERSIKMPRALLSVSDKRGLVYLARGLQAAGWQLVASGGTAAALRGAGLAVIEVAEVTGSPEVLGGRVKTLHPAIHAGILARDLEADRAELAAHGWAPFELVVVNLYPFGDTVAKPGATLDDAVENIDIGGVALLRAAAKNFARVAVVCDPADYPRVLIEIEAGGQVTPETRRELAVKAFAHTSAYDAAIHAYLQGALPADAAGALALSLYAVQSLRYGENPHQSAVLYSYEPGGGPLGGTLLQGKEISYNNLLDLNAAWLAALSYAEPAICIVKHLSPCGIAVAPRLADAFSGALASDPVSAFGGVIAANVPFDADTARGLGELFVECIAAPDFTGEAREVLAARKNCRLLRIPESRIDPSWELRSINRGILWQSADSGDPASTGPWRVVTKRAPSADEEAALRFAWTACRHVKSNAIVFARALGSGFATVGIGGGQPNRVDCVRIAAERAGASARGAVCASDAFFPFPDGIEAAARAGVTAIVQPGGSVRDEQGIAAADGADVAMVFTGVRHFRH